MDNLGFEDDRKISRQENYKNIKRAYTFDEAAALCGNGKYHKIIFFVSGVCLLMLMTSTLSVGFYVMYVKCDLHVSVYEQGLLASTAYIGIVVSSHTWGFLSDTWGRLQIIRISIFGSVVLAIMSAFSYTTWMLIVLRLLVGILICGTQSSIFSYLSEFHSSKTRTQAITYLSTFLPLALILLPALSIAILPLQFDWTLYGKPFSSWRLLEITCTIPGILACMALPFVPESPKYLFTKGDHEGSLKVLRSLYRYNTGKNEYEYPVQEFSDREQSGNLKEVYSVRSAFILIWNQTIPMFHRTRICVSLNLLAHIFVSYFVAHGVFMWFPEILTSMVKHRGNGMTVCEIMRYEFQLSANTTGGSTGNLGCGTHVDVVTYEAMIIMGGVYTILYFFVGYLIKPVGKKRLLVFFFLVSGINGICLVWSRDFYLTMFLFIAFLCVGVCGGIITTISIDYYPTSISAMSICLIMMVGRLGVVAGSNSVGLILNYNCEAIFYGLGCSICAVIILTLLLPNNLSGKNETLQRS